MLLSTLRRPSLSQALPWIFAASSSKAQSSESMTWMSLLQNSLQRVAGDLRYTQVKFGVLRLLLQNSLQTAAGDLRYTQVKFVRYTQVKGEFSKMRALTNLQTRDLYKTQVTGDIDGLRGLTNLERLFLSITQVQGDLSRMLALKNLQGLDQAARGVVAQGLEHASQPAILLMKSAAGQGEPLSRVARLGV